ncbi:MAG TPA: glycoside hydrolase family 2 TIM barrel-domain containing protein [Phycisphaerae bacterium]|nr:glycoside hydrolase family 2 TIM barrel-domain containing protein [Phycisphaerae bacterium]
MRILPVAAILTMVVMGATAVFAESPPTAREKINFDKSWRFSWGELPGAEDPKFPDAAWQELNVPHDYAIEGSPHPIPTTQTTGPKPEGPFDPNSAATDGGGYLNAWDGWYRKTFTLPPSAKGNRVAIQFDGVYMNSDVYLNGKLLGNHPYGYTSFEYDLTPALKDGENILAVHCKIQQPASRWYSGAGIFRHVYLNVRNPVHAATWGTFIQSKANGGSFDTTVNTSVSNDSDAPATVRVTTTLFDPNGKNVGTLESSPQQLAPGANADLTASGKIDSPMLWSLETPQLYRAVSEIHSGDAVVDTVENHFGLRTIEFTKDDGFHLNGKRVQIHGVCNHHDLGALGSAFNTRAAERQLELLKEMGCNAIRTSHNPPAPELLDLCDRMGFVVMDEAFDEWKDSKTDFGYGRFFDEWSERDIVSMVRRDRNHPSIIMWSIGNEIPEQSIHNAQEMATRLANFVRHEDPTRFIVSACNRPVDAVHNGYVKALDVFGINYNAREYTLEPNMPRISSESASALSTRGEYGLVLNSQGDVEIKHRTHTQCTSYDLDRPGWGSTAETSLLDIKHSPWIAGEFVWTGFDYIGEPTPYEWPARSSYFGIIDLAGFKKDRFYIYQSQWTDKPMVHLLPHWNWKGFEGKQIPVWAFTNGDKVELFLNDKSIGVRETKDLVQLHYEWKVPYEPGTLKAVASRGGSVIATDEVTTAGDPAKLQLVADRPTIKADGSDLSFITVKITDSAGNLCPNADDSLQFEVSGAATLDGLDNGDPINHESFKGTTHAAFHGLALAIVRSRETPGDAVITVHSKNLGDAQLTISTK